MNARKASKKLKKHGITGLSASFDGVGIRLTGESGDWGEIVRAGLLCADRKSGFHVINDVRYTGEIPPARLPALEDKAIDGEAPDVLVIGAGIVGASIARELTKNDISVLLVEKECDVSLAASGRNDGCVHPGIDLLPGTLKQKYNLAGNRMFDRICGELDVEFSRQGQILCFGNALLYPVMALTIPYFRAMGLGRVRLLTRKQLREAEPAVSPDTSFGMFFPTGGIVCPYSLTIAYAENAVQNGARLSLDTAVTGMETQNGRIVSVTTNRGTVYPKVVVNAAGVFSEDIAGMAGDRFFSIHPRKGTNSILDKKAKRIVNTSYSRMGSIDKKSHSKGGGIVGTIDGNVLVGPDAHETCEKEDFTTTADSIKHTFDKHRGVSPELSNSDIITYFSGIRAAAFEEDFIVEKGRAVENIVHAAGIQSPGLTAAPAIALEIERLCVEHLERIKPVEINKKYNPRREGIPKLSRMAPKDRARLIEKNPDYGEIVCRCEEISRGEIIDALRRPVPCATADGVKRRVRPGMGRCQGGFCGPLVASIISSELGIPLEQVRKSGEGSEILIGAKGDVI